MTSDEEEILASLLAKKKAEDSGNVVRLLPGGRQDDTPLVQKIRDLLKEAEAGHFEEFVFVGLKPKRDPALPLQDAHLSWSGSLSFAMLGAVMKSVNRLLSG
jgi:hypothetical protein